MNSRNSFSDTPPIVLNLIIINALVYFAQTAFGGMNDANKVNDLFALHHIYSPLFKPYQLITHMFMHGGFFHLLLNMFGLWMFGSMMERMWGPQRFLAFFLICGIAAGFAQLGSYVHDYWAFDHIILSAEEQPMYTEEMLPLVRLVQSWVFLRLMDTRSLIHSFLFFLFLFRLKPNGLL